MSATSVGGTGCPRESRDFRGPSRRRCRLPLPRRRLLRLSLREMPGRHRGLWKRRPGSAGNRKENGWRLRWRGFEFDYPAPGEHNLTNLAGAFRIALHYGVEPGLAVQAASGFRPVSGRNEFIRGKFTLITTATTRTRRRCGRRWNAGKSSGRKVAILADMRELGEFSRNCTAESERFFAHGISGYRSAHGRGQPEHRVQPGRFGDYVGTSRTSGNSSKTRKDVSPGTRSL